MYLQITNICNMTCPHCAFNCNNTGEHMTMDTFRAAIEFAENNDSEIATIGGGEPTLHPHFWEILGLSLGTFEHLLVVTNGSNTEISLKLAKMAKKGILSADLSQDEHHDTIDYEVIEAFTKPRRSRSYDSNDNDLRNIRTVTTLMKTGRALENFADDDPIFNNGCVCDEWIIKPNGDITQCGCSDSPVIGNIFDGILPEFENNSPSCCHKELEAMETDEEDFDQAA